MEANNSFELNNKSQWNKVLESLESNTRKEAGSQKKFSHGGGHVMKRRKMVMKSRRVRVPQREGEGRGIETRVRTLKSLIPISQESKDLEGLFRVTADYILGLQMRVRVMQMMVDSLTPGSDHE